MDGEDDRGALNDGRRARAAARQTSPPRFVEWDWDIGEPHGTAIPLRVLDDLPPDDDHALLAWLADREGEHQEEVRANWEVVIGLELPATD